MGDRVGSEWTTVALRKDMKRKLEEIKKKIEEDTGLTLSMEDTIGYLINFYIKHMKDQGKVEAPAISTGA